LKEIDLLKNEHKTPEYEEINTNKTVPALTHGDIKAGFQIFISDSEIPWPPLIG